MGENLSVKVLTKNGAVDAEYRAIDTDSVNLQSRTFPPIESWSIGMCIGDLYYRCPDILHDSSGVTFSKIESMESEPLQLG